METREQLHQRVRHEQQLKARLRLATTRLAEAEQERIWAIVAAHSAGLSIRQVDAATGLCRSRIHPLLHYDEAHDIPTCLSALRDHDHAAHDASKPEPPSSSQVQARL